MKNKLFVSILLVGIVTGILVGCEKQRVDPPPVTDIITEPVLEEPSDNENADVILTMPEAGQLVSAPLVIEGKAKGSWYFEASFPVRLLDDKGNELAVTHAQAQEEWMQPGYVRFKAVIEKFNPGSATQGKLVLEKDNPSGLPENDKKMEFPVGFLPGETSSLKVFFGNTVKDPEMLDCGQVFAVERVIPKTRAVAMAALTELLKGPTASEKTNGYFTTLNTDIKIQRLVIENGVAKVDFDKQLEFQVGGSCRVVAVRAQIRQTLMQFPTVREVVISIDGRTEDILQP